MLNLQEVRDATVCMVKNFNKSKSKHVSLFLFFVICRTAKQRNPVLTNILEEGNSPEEPRSFEQDELYLEECLKALDGNAHEIQV